MREIIEKYIKDNISAISMLDEYVEELIEIANILKDSFVIYICGNGGSASTASHMANDFQKMCGLRAFSLTDNVAILTAWANDDCYENVFIRQIENISLDMGYQPPETIIILSGSGDSENLVRLAEWGKDNGKYVIAFLGTDGGKIGRMRDIMKIHVESDQLHTENIHLALDHLLCRLIIGGK